jgi:hypothetical protein
VSSILIRLPDTGMKGPTLLLLLIPVVAA